MLKMSALKVRVGDSGEDFDSVWNDYGSIQTDENGSDGECVPSLQLQDSSYSLFDQDLVFEDYSGAEYFEGSREGTPVGLRQNRSFYLPGVPSTPNIASFSPRASNSSTPCLSEGDRFREIPPRMNDTPVYYQTDLRPPTEANIASDRIQVSGPSSMKRTRSEDDGVQRKRLKTSLISSIENTKQTVDTNAETDDPPQNIQVSEVSQIGDDKAKSPQSAIRVAVNDAGERVDSNLQPSRERVLRSIRSFRLYGKEAAAIAECKVAKRVMHPGDCLGVVLQWHNGFYVCGKDTDRTRNMSMVSLGARLVSIGDKSLIPPSCNHEEAIEIIKTSKQKMKAWKFLQWTSAATKEGQLALKQQKQATQRTTNKVQGKETNKAQEKEQNTSKAQGKEQGSYAATETDQEEIVRRASGKSPKRTFGRGSASASGSSSMRRRVVKKRVDRSPTDAFSDEKKQPNDEGVEKATGWNYKCHVCNKAFKTPSLLARHCNTARHKINVRNKNFFLEGGMNSAKEQMQIYHCKWAGCSRSFLDFDIFRDHVSVHALHEGFPPSKSTLIPCRNPTCKKTFSCRYPGALLRHELLHAGINSYGKYTCLNCNQVFSSLGKLNRHQDEEHFEGQVEHNKIDENSPQLYSCLACKFVTKRRNVMLKHLKVHRLSARKSEGQVTVNPTEKKNETQSHWTSKSGDLARKKRDDLISLSLKTGKSLDNLIMETLNASNDRKSSVYAVPVSEGKTATASDRKRRA